MTTVDLPHLLQVPCFVIGIFPARSAARNCGSSGEADFVSLLWQSLQYADVSPMDTPPSKMSVDRCQADVTPISRCNKAA